MDTQYKHLSADERIAIHRGPSQGQSLRAIAACLGRPASTVSRVFQREILNLTNRVALQT